MCCYEELAEAAGLRTPPLARPRLLTHPSLLPLAPARRSDFDKARSTTSLDDIAVLQVQGEVYRDQLEVR